MPKELIVSVNGREKKIAIIENERVTEFYIERGEENQGIVGNIYKGRVMRVLPGMQSAFVDIGLERDAFLYVSDFFDEEEEFERIVMDKSKKGDAAASVADRAAAAERIEQARLEREHHIEATQERVEPIHEAEEAPASITDEAEFMEELPSVATTTTAQPEEVSDVESAGTPSEQANEAEGGGRRRGRRGRRRGKGADEQTVEPEAMKEALQVGAVPVAEGIETPFNAGAATFERVIDEDERAAEDGSMLKDAIMQERLFDQIHAVEFDMEGVPEAEVGSLLSTGVASSASFERVDDSDLATDIENRETAPVQQQVAAHVDAFVDEISEDAASSQSFERVSDDERAVEAGITQVEEAPARTRRGKRAAATTTTAAATTTTAARRGAKKTATKAASGEAGVESAPEATPKAKRASTKKASTTKSTTKKASASRKTSAKKGRTRRSEASDGGETAASAAGARKESVASEAAGGNDPASAGGTSGGDQFYEDAEASITGINWRAEFATRRGGRRRRRSGGKPQEAGGEDERSNGSNGEAETFTEIEDAPSPPPPPPPAARPATREHSRRERPERERSSRDDRSSSSRGSRGAGGGAASRRERPQQPTITDLLREGQEILVQIAKEPIAKKGARITSHIALPGRFLVYMPTVEHVGVSRKIESDSERVRLRKLIQLIRAEEDVPSGGFIVRTAGIGISEEDLRDDARYLVRTWLDMRRTAEKAKAPSLVHRDLDLVQRLLRDQLSDDFTAIRVDSEEEYLGIVEFVNRIQPRMVKRVKLHTRDEPILEAYGVQAEVDKAIKPRVWLRSGGYLVINQTEALVAIDVNTGKFVGRGGSRLEDTITRTNLEAVDEIVRQIRLRDLGGIIVLDLIDMEDRRNRNRVMQALQEALQHDKSPTKVLSFNDFGLVIMTRKRVKQSLERTLCAPCPYCQGAGLVKSPQTICYEILEESRRLARSMNGDVVKQTTLRINPEVARALRSTERDVLTEIEDYLGAVDIISDDHIHQEQFDFALL
ncbi:MAG TPA: Rne/Rng family ribonuclease [Pyrinomonadaceae bacterium]